MSGGLQGAFSDADWVSLCGSDRDLALVVTGIVHALDDEHRHGAEAVRRLVEGMRGGMRHEALGMYSEADLALVVQQLVAGEDWVLGARTLRGARPKAAAELRGLLGVALEEVLAASWPLGPSELRAVASAIRGVLRGWDRQSPLEGVQ